MSSIDPQIAALRGGTASTATGNTDVAQTQAASPVVPARDGPTVSVPRAQQDTVSLSGTRPPQQQQQSASSRGNAQPSTFTLLAQTTTFPPSHEPAIAATPPTTQSDASAPAAAGQTATAAAQSPVATATVNADATATAAAASASSTAPAQQTLQQLDRVLQQLGIDPQTLSLISREGMLNWVNDPAALRQIVQNVQAAADSSRQNAAVGSANPEQSTAQLAIAGDNQNQPQASVQETSQDSTGSSAASSANTNALGQSAATAQQNATAVMQFQKLQDSLAPSGPAESQPAATSSGTTTPQGQLLNVSA